MKLMRMIPVALAALTLAGCLNLSHSSTVQPLAAAGHVEEITVSHEGVKTPLSPDFDEKLKARLKVRLDKCATGPQALRLEARVYQVNKANVLFTALVLGENKVLGDARLIDPASGQTVGDYKIGRTIIGRGLAVLQMAEAEKQLSDAFAAEVCKQAFPAPKP